MIKGKLAENFLLPLIISATVFLFIRPFNLYLFGQDAIPFFGQYSYYQNPMYSFNNGIEMIFFTAITESFDMAIRDVLVAQRLLIFIAAYIASIGFFDLIDVLFFFSNNVHRRVSKIVGLCFFLYNPFTLSVTWWHFAAWSLLLLLSPFLISFLVDTTYNRGSIRRFSITSVLTIIFCGGIMGGFFPFFALTVGLFLLILILRMITNWHNSDIFNGSLRALSYIVCFVGVTTLWALIPLYYSTFVLTSPNYSYGYLTAFMNSESVYTTLPKVLMLTGFGWLYLVPDAYPWIGSLQTIQTASLFIVMLVPFSLAMLRKYPKLAPLSLIALLAVVFSTGSNFPFDFLNKSLLMFGGPFLFLVNPYYFTLQFYVLFLSVLLSLIISISLSKISIQKNQDAKIINVTKIIRKNYTQIAVLVVIFLMVGTFAYPFISDQVYQNNGQNIDAINLNNGICELSGYLHKNYSSPDYLTLMIPFSTITATYLTYNNNSTFADSRGLISTMDPFPLIWQNNSYLAQTIENIFSSNNLSNLGVVMTFLHVRYIIYTSHFDQSTPFMTRSPNGNAYNFSKIITSLKASFGEPFHAGIYDVFFNRNAEPVVGLVNDPVYVNASLPSYLYFLSSVNQSLASLAQTNLLESAFVSRPNLNFSNISIFPYKQPETLRLPFNTTHLLMNNGSIVSPGEIGINSIDGNASFNLLPSVNLTNTSTFSTTMHKKQNTFYSNFTANITSIADICSPSIIYFDFKISEVPYNGRSYVDLLFGNLTVSIQFLNLSQGNGMDTLSICAFYPNKTLYAWENTLIPSSIFFNNTTNLKVETSENNSLAVSLSSGSYTTLNPIYFYFGTKNYKLNPGYNSTGLGSYASVPDEYKFTYLTGGSFPTTVSKLAITHLLPIHYIIEEDFRIPPSFINVAPKVTVFGNYELQTNNVMPNVYVYFFGYPSGDWTAHSAHLGKDLPLVSSNNFTLIFSDSNSSLNGTIVLQYRSIQPISIILSIGTVIVLLSFIVVGPTMYQRMRKMRNGRAKGP